METRSLTIQNSSSKKPHESAYRDMLEDAYWVCAYGKEAAEELYSYDGGSWLFDLCRGRDLADTTSGAVFLLNTIIDQTHRRVLKNRELPPSEFVVSLFETHTDIIAKSGRKTAYGHKVFVVCGKSNRAHRLSDRTRQSFRFGVFREIS